MMMRFKPGKYSVMLLLCTLSFLMACSTESERQHLAKVDQLIKSKQYYTAFQYLDSLDPAHKNKAYVLQKIHLAMQYHSNTIMHEMFEFHDLQKGQKLEDFKKEVGDFKMKDFSLKNRWDTLLLTYPQDGELHAMAAQFFYDMYRLYPGGWKLGSKDLLAQMEEHARLAVKHSSGDAICHFILGYTEAVKDNHKGAIGHYAIALHKDPGLGVASYNLAFSQLKLGQHLSALAAALGATETFTDSFNRSEAYRLCGFICETLSDDKTAWDHFSQAVQWNPHSLKNLHAITDISMRLPDKPYGKYARLYLDQSPEDEGVYSGLVEIYSQYGKGKELVQLFADKISQSKDRPLVMGHLHYFTAGLVHREDKNKALQYLELAQQNYAKVLASDHEIFDIIQTKQHEFGR